jgi:hypothetical protein
VFFLLFDPDCPAAVFALVKDDEEGWGPLEGGGASLDALADAGGAGEAVNEDDATAFTCADRALVRVGTAGILLVVEEEAGLVVEGGGGGVDKEVFAADPEGFDP